VRKKALIGIDIVPKGRISRMMSGDDQWVWMRVRGVINGRPKGCGRLEAAEKRTAGAASAELTLTPDD
jgi:hypothetical protein